MIRPGLLDAAIEKLRAIRDGGRLSRAEKRAVVLLGGGTVRGPAKAAIPSLTRQEQRRIETDRAVRDAKTAMRKAVFDWNLANTSDAAAPFGRCDCGCGYAFRHADEGECDHWKGGSSREHTRENGWRLRRECHEKKDGRRPTPACEPRFNARRAAYCERAGIPFVPRKELHHG